MSGPVVKWGPQRASESDGKGVIWVAKYRGWHLRASEKAPGLWFVSAHQGNQSCACRQNYATLEGAQNAAEFYAEQLRWPHEYGPLFVGGAA